MGPDDPSHVSAVCKGHRRAAVLSSICLGQASWHSELRAAPQTNEWELSQYPFYHILLAKANPKISPESKAEKRDSNSWGQELQNHRGVILCHTPVNERRGVITTSHLCKPFHSSPEARTDRGLGSTVAGDSNHDWKTCKMCWESHIFRILWWGGECENQEEWRRVLIWNASRKPQRWVERKKEGRRRQWENGEGIVKGGGSGTRSLKQLSTICHNVAHAHSLRHSVPTAWEVFPDPSSLPSLPSVTSLYLGPGDCAISHTILSGFSLLVHPAYHTGWV